MRNWLEQACDESQLSIEDCAHALGQPLAQFSYKAANPGMLTLNELRALRSIFNEPARTTLWKALLELRP